MGVGNSILFQNFNKPENNSNEESTTTPYSAFPENDRIPDGETVTITIDDAIDRLGMGPFQRIVLFAAGLCFAADAIEVLLLSFLSLILRDEWGLTDKQAATITSCVFAGALTGSLFLGKLADNLGRKPVFILCGILISLFGILTSFVNNFPTLLVVRFMVGVGVGGLTVPFDIFAEFLPTHHRGTYLMTIEYFWTFGSLVVALIAYLVLGSGGSWRMFSMVCALPCVLSAVVGSYYVPESPRWLIAEGKHAEAIRVLRLAAYMNRKDPMKTFPEGLHITHEEEESSDFMELLAPKWRVVTLLLWGVWFGFAICYYGLIMLVVRVFSESGGGAEADNDDATDSAYHLFDFNAIFISSASEILGVGFVILVIDRIGRVPTQVGAYLLGGISVAALCAMTGIEKERWILLAIAFIARIFEMSGSCTTWVITAEMLSTEIRTTGHGAANAWARIGGILAPYIVQENKSLFFVGIVMVVIHVFTALCASQLPETMDKELGSGANTRKARDAARLQRSSGEAA